MAGAKRLPAELVARFAKPPTSSVSHMLDKLGLPGQVDGLRPMLAGARVCGPAVTLSYMPVGVVGGFLHLAEAGDVTTAEASCAVVVPLARTAEVPRVAEEIEAKDAVNLWDVRAGMDLAEARRRRGYHTPRTKGA